MTDRLPALTAAPCAYCASRGLGRNDWQLYGAKIGSEGRMPKRLALTLAAAPSMETLLRDLVRTWDTPSERIHDIVDRAAAILSSIDQEKT